MSVWADEFRFSVTVGVALPFLYSLDSFSSGQLGNGDNEFVFSV